jgi:hypothetical protein
MESFDLYPSNDNYNYVSYDLKVLSKTNCESNTRVQSLTS